MPENTLVRFENVDGVGVITIDNPPVNALSPGVPEGIVENVERGNADPAIRAMVLIGAGRSFIAGADIRTFGNRPPPVHGRRPHQILDASQKAGRRRDPRLCAGRRVRDSARLELPHRGAERQSRPARSADRHIAGERRDPAPAAADRAKGGARHDRHRPPCAGRGGISPRHHRRTGAGRQRSARGGDRLCPPRRRYPAIAAHPRP